MEIQHRETGTCGLSCRLCPRYHTEGTSRCGGCKSEFRMSAGCPFITCAIKKRGLEFCWECDVNDSCELWKGHRTYGKQHDTFTCYAALEENIAYILANGMGAFVAIQNERERLLRSMLAEFNEGRSKTYYCIAATRLSPTELEESVDAARKEAAGQDLVSRSKALHAQLGKLATKHSIPLKLRK